jgi:hypothetical protein
MAQLRSLHSTYIIYIHTHFFIYLTLILPGQLTEKTLSFTATTWGVVTGERWEMNEPIGSWG